MHPIEKLLRPLGRAFRDRRAGEAASFARAPELATEHRIALSSPAFGDGEEIPAKHCGWLIGDDVSPALQWSALPTGTEQLVLVFEDIDGPGTTPRIHTVALLPPRGDGLAEGALTPSDPDIRFVPRGRRPGRYAGPRPLPGHGPHVYRFHLYALDRPIDPDALHGIDDLPTAAKGHVLAAGMLAGTRES